MGLIFLCGLPGCGKTTVGKALADILGLPFIDLDEEIERECGRSINNVFAKDGEAFFRVLETQALTRACAHGNAVIALGAGALEYEENLSNILECGKLVYLRTPDNIILNRVADWKERPLFKECGTEQQVAEKLQELLARRESSYLKAEVILDVIDTDGVEAIAERLAGVISDS